MIICHLYPLSLLHKTGAAMTISRRVEWRQAPTEPGLSVDRDISQHCIAIPSAGDDNFIYIGRLIWDATCADTFSAGNLIASATNPGSAARSAEESKIAKYSGLADRFHFVPVAIETSGVLGPQSLRFLKEIGHKAALERHEPRELEWFLQRISLAVVRGNALSVLSAGRCSEGS